MPDEATEVVEVVEQAPDAVVQQQTPTQGQEPVQVVVVDGVQQVVEQQAQEVSRDVEGYIDAYMQTEMQQVAANHTELLTELRAMRNESNSNENGVAQTVTLSDGQFSQIEQDLAIIRNGASVSLFVSFLTMLLVCIVIGTRLWSVMSRGWNQ